MAGSGTSCRRTGSRAAGARGATSECIQALRDCSRVRVLEAEGRADDDLGRLVLEAALAVAEAELGGGQARLLAVRADDVRGLEDRCDVGAVGAGIGPDRATDAARHGEPELEAGEAGLLGLRGGPRHGDAGLRDVP